MFVLQAYKDEFTDLFTIWGNFRKYFENILKKMVGNEGFGYEVAMKGGLSLGRPVYAIFEHILKKTVKIHVLTSVLPRKWCRRRFLFGTIL